MWDHPSCPAGRDPSPQAELPSVSWPAHGVTYAGRERIDGQRSVAQTFTAGQTGVVSRLRVSVIPQAGAFPPDMDLRVQLTQYGSPDGPGSRVGPPSPTAAGGVAAAAMDGVWLRRA